MPLTGFMAASELVRLGSSMMRLRLKSATWREDIGQRGCANWVPNRQGMSLQPVGRMWGNKHAHIGCKVKVWLLRGGVSARGTWPSKKDAYEEHASVHILTFACQFSSTRMLGDFCSRRQPGGDQTIGSEVRDAAYRAKVQHCWRSCYCCARVAPSVTRPAASLTHAGWQPFQSAAALFAPGLGAAPARNGGGGTACRAPRPAAVKRRRRRG